MSDNLVQVEFAPGSAGVEGRLSLILAAPPPEVWRALVDADRLGDWLAPGRIDPRVGGRARIDFGQSGAPIDSRVTHWEPQARLGYGWNSGAEPVRSLVFDLEPAPEGTALRLTVRLPPSEDAPRALAGWACHLEMLAAALAGVPISFPFVQFKAYRAAFGERLQPA